MEVEYLPSLEVDGSAAAVGGIISKSNSSLIVIASDKVTGAVDTVI